MAFFCIRDGHHQTRDSESLQWVWVYLGGHRLLHQVGGNYFLQKCHPSCGGPILEIKHHLPLRIPAKLITSNGKNPKWKKDWHKFLPFALCTYRTSVRTSMGATPYSLVYGMEAVLPVKVEIPSLRILSQTKLSEAEWAHSRYEQLHRVSIQQ